MWIHESFTNYSENLYVEYFYGKEAGGEYVRGTRRSIRNDRPIIGHYDVNHRGSGDMYSKGGNMLHTLRQIVNDDDKWREILRGLNQQFYHQTVTSRQIEEYIIEKTGINLVSFFNQYLRDERLPVFEYAVNDDSLMYRWSNCIRGFDMPLKISVSGNETWLFPSTRWSTTKLNVETPVVSVDKNFYVARFNITGN